MKPPRVSQEPAEIEWLAGKIQSYTSLIEIGSYEGASLTRLAKAMPRGSLLISIDLPGGPWGRRNSKYALAAAADRLSADGYDVEVYLRSSRDSRTLLRQLPQQVDVLFIDGDHSYDGVRFDYETYGPLVRPGGLIAFHDIAPHPRVEVHEFWKAIRGNFYWEEFKVHACKKGIGVLYVPT